MTQTTSDFFHDKKGVPIYAGDLLRSYHFTGARRKTHYLYHVAVLKDGGMDVVPTSHLEASKINGGGRVRLSDNLAKTMEIIHSDCYPSHEDREKVKL